MVRDWLNENEVILEVRIYMVDKVFLNLIFGVEKLLLEVDKRGLIDGNGEDFDFNFINFLV